MSEMLRYNAPVQGLRRDAFVPIEVDDVSLAAGEP